MNNETLIDAMVEAIAAAVLAKIGQSTINQELDMIRSDMTGIHNRILEITRQLDKHDTLIGDCLLDVARVEMTVEALDETVTRDDVVDIVRDTLSGATLSIYI